MCICTYLFCEKSPAHTHKNGQPTHCTRLANSFTALLMDSFTALLMEIFGCFDSVHRTCIYGLRKKRLGHLWTPTTWVSTVDTHDVGVHRCPRGCPQMSKSFLPSR